MNIYFVQNSAIIDNGTIETWLTDRGHTVTKVERRVDVPADIGDYDLVVVGSGAQLYLAPAGMAQWNAITVPQLDMDSAQWDESNRYGSSRLTQNDNDVVFPDPVEAWLSDAGFSPGGSVVYTATGQLFYMFDAAISADAVKLFHRSGRTDHWYAIEYEAGDTMASGATAGGPIILLGFEAEFDNLNATGDSLVEAIVAHLGPAGGGGEGGDTALAGYYRRRRRRR